MSLTGSLLVGKSALLTKQEQMATIGNNVSNADRASYHKQVVETSDNYPVNHIKYSVGTGVSVERVTRNFDAALEGNLRTAYSEEGLYNEYSRYLEILESAVAENGNSVIVGAVSDFANSLQDLANNPESVVHRRALIANAERVSEAYNLQHKLVTDVQGRIAASDTQGTLPERVTQFNTLSEEIATLNDRIKRIESTFIKDGQEANTFRDERDRLVGEMAKLADVTVTEQNNGTYLVELNGHTVVDDTATPKFNTIDFTLTAGATAYNWSDDASAVTLNSGEIKGLDLAYNYVGDRITDINTYIATFANEMNTQHALGFDNAGNPGTALFDATTPGAMTVSISNPDLIAAADNNTNSGDGDNARAMWQRMTNPIAGINGDTLTNKADKIIDEIAIETNKNKALYDTAKFSTEMFQQSIHAFSGVSVDEEMIHMLEIQRSFQAAGKFVSAVDELLQTVINMV